jgi:transcription antitermination factor NusG
METRWYCVRTRQKQEQIAGEMLRRVRNLEVYSPRLRIRRNTRRGPVWFVEALFPGYIFARFSLADLLHAVRATPGVQAVVGFGSAAATVPDSEMEDLRRNMNFGEILERDATLSAGDEVTISGGSFKGLGAVVHRVFSGTERVQVLLEFLGRMVQVELPSSVLERAVWLDGWLIGLNALVDNQVRSCVFFQCAGRTC